MNHTVPKKVTFWGGSQRKAMAQKWSFFLPKLFGGQSDQESVSKLSLPSGKLT